MSRRTFVSSLSEQKSAERAAWIFGTFSSGLTSPVKEFYKAIEEDYIKDKKEFIDQCLGDLRRIKL